MPLKSLLLLCICGFILLGLAGLGLIVWFLTNERRNANASDHGALGGLGDDDHPQYLTATRAGSFFSGGDHDHSLVDLQDVVADAPREGQVLAHIGGRWQAQDLQSRGVQPHSRQLVTVRHSLHVFMNSGLRQIPQGIKLKLLSCLLLPYRCSARRKTSQNF